MKYLVDLNYTLVGNSPKWGEPRITPFSRQIGQETYRQWLVDFLRDKYAAQTGWQPQEAYFAEIFASPPKTKEDLLLRYIFPKQGKNGADFFGIESNPKTREMYKKYGIKSLKFSDFKKQTVDKFA